MANDEYDVDHSKQTRKSWPCKELVDIFPNQLSLGGSALPIVEKSNLNKSCEGCVTLPITPHTALYRGPPARPWCAKANMTALLGEAALSTPGYECNDAISESRR